METALAALMEWTHANPNWAGLVVMAVSALESFLVVGLFVPGSVVMFGIGAMIAAGHMELAPTLAWATFGAVLGDGTSYLIGRFYHQHLRVMWPFRRYPQMIARGVGMLSYRASIGLEERFGRDWFKKPGETLGKRGMYNIESWLRHHGKKAAALLKKQLV